MNRNVRLLLLAAIVLLAAAGSWLLLKAPAEKELQQAKAIWNYSVWGAPRAFTSGVERIAEILKEESGGAFEMKIHYASALAPEKENIDAIKLGTIEAAHVCFGYHPGKVPIVQVTELPFLLTDDVRVNARVLDAFFHHPLVERELAERWNMKYLALAVLPTFEFMGNKRIAGTADLKGLRVRVLGGYGYVMQDLGAVPVMMTAPEAYTALERGTMDVMAFPWTDSFGAFRIHEVSKYATLGLRIGGFACISGVSLDAWNALPGKLKAALPRMQQEAIDAYLRAYEKTDAQWLPIFREKLDIVDFPKAERDRLLQLSVPYWEKWAKEADAQGMPGSEMLRFMQDEIAKARKELGG